MAHHTDCLLVLPSTRVFPKPDQIRPTVQLLHVLADGSSHVDWMIAQDSRGRDPLITFRLSERIDETARGGRIEARRLADHRARYLTYEGPVTDDRGTVTRIAQGRIISFHQTPDAWTVEVQWAGTAAPPQVLHLVRREGDDWIIEVLDKGIE